MILRILVSWLLISIFGIGGITLSYAQDDLDREYAQMIEKDSRSIEKGDPLFQVGESIRDDRLDKKSVKMARKTLDDYIASLELYDVHWKGKHPKPLGSPIPYYTDDESAPITYEWKIQCDDTRDCGSVIVAMIDTESRIMEAGTYGTANYERLVDGKVSQKNKLYYYSPFDQYIERDNEKTTTVDMIDPEKQIKKFPEERKTLLKSKKESRKEMRKGGKMKFFTELTSEGEKTSQTVTPTAVVDVSPMAPTTNCQSAVPCYSQFSQSYGSPSISCASGCSPTAMAIIFGYYDRKGLFPNLYGNASQIAPDRGSTDSLFQSMVNTLRTYMQTYCIGGEGGTDANKIPLGMQYARDRGYGNSPNSVYSAGGASFLFPRIRTEINAARPLIATFGDGTGAHSVVVYGYNDTGVLTTSQVRINYGWDSTQPDRLVSISTAIGDGTKISNYSLKNIITVPVKF